MRLASAGVDTFPGKGLLRGEPMKIYLAMFHLVRIMSIMPPKTPLPIQKTDPFVSCE